MSKKNTIGDANSTGSVEEALDAIEVPRTAKEGESKLGTFVVINHRIKGLRFNLAGIRSYAMSGENSIQVGYDSSSTNLIFKNAKEAEEALAFLDSYCL